MKTVLITGAGRGIGLATARNFAAAGWRVLSLDKEFGSEVVGERVEFDLRQIFGLSALIASLGELDTLVNTLVWCIATPSMLFQKHTDPRFWQLISKPRPH